MTRSTVTLASLPLAYTFALVYLGPGNNLMFLMPITAALFLAAGARLWQDLRRERVTLPARGMPLLMAAYLLWLLVSPWWSTWFQVSWYNALGLGTLPLVFLIWVYEPDPDRLWDRLWPLLLVATALAGIWGIIQYVLTQHRSNGPFLDYNSYAAVFVLFLLPVLFRYLTLSQQPRGNRWRLRGLELFMAIAFGALFVAYSRGATGTLLIVLPAAVLLARRYYRRVWVPLLIFAVIGACTYTAVKTYPSKTIHRNLDLEKDPSLDSRLMMWRSAWDIYKTHPWLGTGLGTFKIYYHGYRDPHETESSGDLAHDDYIEFLQEGGPVQLGFLLATGLCVLVVGIRLLRHLPTRHEARAPPGAGGHQPAEAFGFLLGLTAIYGQTVVNFIFYITALSIIAGLFLARAYRIDTEPPLRATPLAIRPSVSAFALCVLLALPVIGLTLDGLSAMVLGGQSGLSLARRIEHNGHSRYKFAVLLSSLRPDNIIPWVSLAQMDRAMATAAKDPAKQLKMARQARADYLHLLHIVDINPFALHGLATLILQHPSLRRGLPPRYDRDPATLLVDAIKQNPQFVQPYLDLSRLLEKQGHDSAALGVLAGFFNTWLDVPGSARAQDIKLVDRALHLAVKLHRRKAARTLAAALLQQEPYNRFARDALAHRGKQTEKGAGRRKIAPEG